MAVRAGDAAGYADRCRTDGRADTGGASVRDFLGFLLWLVLGRVVDHGNGPQLLAGSTKTGCWFSMGDGMARIKCTACPFKDKKCLLLESAVFTVGELRDVQGMVAAGRNGGSA